MFKLLRYFSLTGAVAMLCRVVSVPTLGILLFVLQVFWAVTPPPVLAQDTAISPIVVMGDESYPPYESVVDGEPVGINVDLWREIAKILGRPLDLRLYQWADSQARVRRGEAKVLTFMSINKERTKLYDFSQPTFTSRFPVFVNDESADKFNMSDLTGKRIAVKKGGFPRTIIENIHPEAEMVFVDSALGGFRKLLRGEVDGVMEDERVGNTILRENGFQGIRATPKAMAVKTGHIAVVKGNPALLRQIDAAVGALKSSGEFDQLMDKWASSDTVHIKRETITFIIVMGLATIVLVLSLVGAAYILSMRKSNRKLRKEIAERERAEDKIQTLNENLERRVDERTSALHRLNGRLISAQEDERRRIARELHDDFNQRLALLAVDLERLHDGPPVSQESLTDDLASLLRRTKKLSSDIHSLSHQLHPSILQHLGLVAATKSLCKEISDQHAIDIEFVHHGVPRSLPGGIALCLYRIVQEALRNVIKHSGAESARIEITGTAGELGLKISDNGVGFDLECARKCSGLGILSMHERLRQVNGTISFMQIEPTGTRIGILIPFSD
ncbi:MAG: transporter substrate-binding domain-containing protein [Alphaproteobacteria bacterium]|nr:transporter substrate-binding domain-containing protein [Alphaproteobacteria bacterium]